MDYRLTGRTNVRLALTASLDHEQMSANESSVSVDQFRQNERNLTKTANNPIVRLKEGLENVKHCIMVAGGN